MGEMKQGCAPWIQRVCPSPRRLAQELICSHGLKNGLDVGCGEYSLLDGVRGEGFRSTGIDANEGMLESARRKALHDDFVLGEFMTHRFEHGFDVVVMSHVIEHFAREDGFKALARAEELAVRLVYVETPYGYREQAGTEDNPFQAHRSGWLPSDFIPKGYAVFGSGIRGLRGSGGRARGLPEFVVRLLERGFQWLVFRRPFLAGTISAIKILDSRGNPVRI